MKVSFSHVANFMSRQTLKRTHDHQENWNRKPAFLQTTKKGCTAREVLTAHGGCRLAHGGCQMSVLTKCSRFLPRKYSLAKTPGTESLFQSCGEYLSQTNLETNTRPPRNLERKTCVFIGNKKKRAARHAKC